MKKLFTLLIVLFAYNAANAQYYWSEQFEYPNDGYRSRFVMDTTHANNRWQIGHPNKVVFDSASCYSMPNVIVTDTVNYFPPNDTSVFTMYHVYTHYPMMQVMFYYKLDIDTNMKAVMEISGDNGANWINPITEDTTYMFYWSSKPSLDTSTASWQAFELGLYPWASAIAGGSYTFPHYRTSDTLLFRFTLISGSDTTHRDGWMMDDFMIVNAPMEGLVHSVDLDLNLNCYPVPAAYRLFIANKKPLTNKAFITVTDVYGREIYNMETNDMLATLNFSLPDGVYCLKYRTGGNVSMKMFTIRH